MTAEKQRKKIKRSRRKQTFFRTATNESGDEKQADEIRCFGCIIYATALWCGVQPNCLRWCGEAHGAGTDGEDFCDECLDKELEGLITAEFTWREIYNKMFPNNDLNVLWL